MKSANDFNWISLLTAVLFTFLFAEVLGMPQNYRQRPNRRFQGCETPFETFFVGQCLPIGSTEYCPTDMKLIEGPNKKGICDCENIDNRPAFYSEETGECSLHNTQGPCYYGEWFVLKNGLPQCESIPEGCPADGKHFYGSPKGTMARQCWEIGTEGPCSTWEVLQIEKGTKELKISCKRPLMGGSYAGVPISIGKQAPCRPGTRRNRHGHCARGFY